MKIKVLIGLLVLLIIVNLAALGSFIFFQSRSEPKGKPPFGGPPSGAMDLSREQHRQLRKLMRNFMDEIRPQNEEIRQLESDILELVQQDSVDKDAINRKMQEISAIRLTLSHKAIDQFVEMKTFLSPEQQKHFFHLLMQGKPPHRPGRGQGRGRPPRGGPPH